MKRPTDAFWTELAKLDTSLATLNYYQLLSVDPEVDPDRLRASYERQIRVLHPDRHGRESDPERRKALTRVFARVAEAYAVLNHPQNRARYDASLVQGETRFQESRTEQGPAAAAADPTHVQARSLFEQAKLLLGKGDTRGAKAKLSLAKQYEPDSEAIAKAILECDPSGALAASAASAPVPDPPAATAAPQRPAPPSEAAPATPVARAAPKPPPIPKNDVSEAEEEFAKPSISRVHARAPMGQSIKVSCKNWEAIQTFYMHNISRGGMLLRCQTLLPIGSILDLSVLTPDRESIELPAEVVRHVEPNQPGQRPGIGIKFLLIPDNVRERFETLLRVAGLPPKSESETSTTTPSPGPAEQAIASAQALIDAGRFSQACQSLQTPVRAHPDDNRIRSLFHLAAGLMARERDQEAAAHIHFERALRADPDSVIVLRLLREKPA